MDKTLFKESFIHSSFKELYAIKKIIFLYRIETHKMILRFYVEETLKLKKGYSKY